MKSKKLGITLLANVVAFAVNMGINFFLTPFIVGRVSAEAYGFVSLANNFSGYAQVITVALNSMAGRFFTIEYHKGNKKAANEYFTSVLFANGVLSLFLAVSSVVCVLFLGDFLHVSAVSISDIMALFSLVFAAFIVTLIGTTYSVSTFAADRLDLAARRNIESYMIKAVMLISLYLIFEPHVYYVGLVSFVMSLYLLAANVRYTKKLLPDIHVDRKHFNIGKIITLLKVGVWNSIARLGNVLNDGLDLLIANLFVGGPAMGALAVAKVLPTAITVLISTVNSIFLPGITIAYAKEAREEVLGHVRREIVILSMLSNAAFCVLAVAGQEFFTLWVPAQDAGLLHILSLITIAGLMVNGGIQCMFNIYSVVAKPKIPCLITVFTSLLCIGVVFVFIKTTNLGIFAIAGCSSLASILRSIFFYIPYAAKCIDVKTRFFMQPVTLNVLSLLLSIGCGYLLRLLMPLDSWLHLAVFSCALIFVATMMNIVIATTKKEKAMMLHYTAKIFKK